MTEMPEGAVALSSGTHDFGHISSRAAAVPVSRIRLMVLLHVSLGAFNY